MAAVEYLPVLHYTCSSSVKLAVAVQQHTAKVSSTPVAVVAVATATDVLLTSHTSL